MSRPLHTAGQTTSCPPSANFPAQQAAQRRPTLPPTEIDDFPDSVPAQRMPAIQHLVADNAVYPECNNHDAFRTQSSPLSPRARHFITPDTQASPTCPSQSIASPRIRTDLRQPPGTVDSHTYRTQQPIYSNHHYRNQTYTRAASPGRNSRAPSP